MGLPLVLAINMMDEAENRGVTFDHLLISERLGLQIVPTIATQNRGIHELTNAVRSAQPLAINIDYPPEIESALPEIEARIPDTPIAARALALLWLSGDSVADEWIQENVSTQCYHELLELRHLLQLSFFEPLVTVIQQQRLAYAQELTSAALSDEGKRWHGLSVRLGHMATHPLWGFPLLAAVMYAVYWFVGVFGAGTLVDYIEGQLFGEVVNPWLIQWLTRIVPIPWLIDLLVGEYGLWTMGMTYALALILPIVSTFFLAFGILEDSGYLPRLAVLSNRVFRLIGLNGRAVLPMVLGLGCVTMATMTTRILENKRDRILVTLLLALAVPCSAQLGVVMGLLAGISFTATLIWGGLVVTVFLVVGWLAARLLPGERSTLLVELPPLRRPIPSNVIAKTVARVEWYLREVVPLFLLGTAALFALDQLGILPWMTRVGEPLVVGWLGLPAEASAAFLMGFLRRDFGASGLFLMESQGLLNPPQVIVAMVTITLFVPCLASVFMIAKERGGRTAVAIAATIFPLAFVVGGLLHRLLLLVGWQG